MIGLLFLAIVVVLIWILLEGTEAIKVNRQTVEFSDGTYGIRIGVLCRKYRDLRWTGPSCAPIYWTKGSSDFSHCRTSNIEEVKKIVARRPERLTEKVIKV